MSISLPSSFTASHSVLAPHRPSPAITGRHRPSFTRHRWPSPSVLYPPPLGVALAQAVFQIAIR
ncbi:hypothetical protein V2J09_006448 [Rumex salicifolius]